MQETWAPTSTREAPLEEEREPTPVLWPGKSHGQRSLVDYSPRGRRVGHDLANEHARPSTLILRVLMNHRISNLLGVGMAGMSAHKSAPVNLTRVIFFFLTELTTEGPKIEVRGLPPL